MSNTHGKAPETVEHFLRAAAARLTGSSSPHLDVRVLARKAFGVDDAELILAAPRPVAAAERSAFEGLLQRRLTGEPVSQILGEKEFFGLTFQVAPGVLTPRPDSETLVEAAMAARMRQTPRRVLDLGTGTGCLLCALLSVFPKATGVGVDISQRACATARRNAAALGLAERTSFVAADWSAPIAGEFDIIVANPPYIPEGAGDLLNVDVRDFEDPRALFAGAEGLDSYRQILAEAPGRIAAKGLIILELGAAHETPVRAMAAGAFPAAHISVAHDLAGRARALIIDLEPEKKV